MLEKMRATSTKSHDTLWWWNTLKRRPWHYTLDFYTKVQVWGRESNYKIPYKLMVIKKMMSALPCSKKERRRTKNREKKEKIYMTKKERRRESRILLFHTFVVYRQGPWPIHTNHVYNLALLLAWARLHAIKPPLQQHQGFHSHMPPVKNAQVQE